MPSKRDIRYKVIGGRHRASARYAMLLNRTKNCTERNACYAGIEVRISKDEFVAWFMAHDFPGCSVDRIRSDGHYELGNLKLIPKEENAGKDKRKARSGRCRCYRCDRVKPLSEFVAETRRLTGYSTICLDCEAARFHARKNKVN